MCIYYITTEENSFRQRIKSMSMPLSETHEGEGEPGNPRCPVCGRLFETPALEAHVDRCLRQSAHRTKPCVSETSATSSGGESAWELHSSELSSCDDDDTCVQGVSSTESRVTSSSSRKRSLPHAASASRAKASSRKRRRLLQQIRGDMDLCSYLRRLAGLSEIESTADGECLSERYQTDVGANVTRRTWDLLYEHQRQGCEWLWGLYTEKCGGILADEMGLGKTAQVCVHFDAVSNSCFKSNAGGGIFLVVCPATVLRHWAREVHTWAPKIRVCIFHSIDRDFADLQPQGIEAIRNEIRRLSRRKESPNGLLIIVTYEGLRNMRKAMMNVEWDGICVDEGQKLRNSSAEITAVCKLLCGYHRILLSGTPIQNSLLELWSLFDFCYPGKLGSQLTFEAEFSEPIREGSYAGSSKYKVDRAFKTALRLQYIIKPYLLRRRKCDPNVALNLPSKKEQVLFCRLSPIQKRIYQEIIGSAEVEHAIKHRRPIFSIITTLRKLCNHPMFAFHRGRIVWHDDSESLDDVVDKERTSGFEDTISALKNTDNVESSKSNVFLSSEIKWNDSGKLSVLSQILPVWYKEGHKVLLFSQTQSMLNMCEELLKKLKFMYLRLDGSTPIKQRDELITMFNSKDMGIYVMLLTTRAGGLGISLTGANRIVIMDPDWNPQTDIQARERAWRIGQERDVTIYRLITKGTIEEKIYKKQISKILLSEKILLNARQRRMPFSKSDIRDMFTLGDDVTDTSTSDKTLTFSGIESNEQSFTCEQDELAIVDKRSCGKDIIVPTCSIESGEETESIDTVGVSPLKVKRSSKDIQKDNLEVTNLPPEQRIERGLVKSLFNGDQIAGVFDYEFALEGPSSNYNLFSAKRNITSTPQSDSTGSKSGSLSGTASRHILDNLKSLGSASQPDDNNSDQSPHYLVSVSDSPGVRSGRSMIFQNETKSRDDACAATPASVVPRLKKIFSAPDCRYSTVELLEKFKDLEDRYAELFRDLLRSVARYDKIEKVWRKR